MFGISSLLANRSASSKKNKLRHTFSKEHHKDEFEQFKAVLESFDITKIDERLSVLKTFLSTDKHVSLPDLIKIMRAAGKHVPNQEFMKETMDMFCQFGFATAMSFENQETLYEHHHLGLHHDHFICTRCGKIQEFHNEKLERLQIDIARLFQFHPLQHKMEIYGLCRDCMDQRDSTITLFLASNGERVKIVKIEGGRQMQARLASMGITVNSCLEMINNNAAGQILVAVDGVRIALNRGMAQKIFVVHSCHHKQ